MHCNPKQLTTRLTIALVASTLVLSSGCQQSLFKNPIHSAGIFKSEPSFETLLAKTSLTAGDEATVAERLAAISGEPVQSAKPAANNNQNAALATSKKPSAAASYFNSESMIVRGQSPGNEYQDESKVVQADGANGNSGKVESTAFQYPDFDTSDRATNPGNGLSSPNGLNPLMRPRERGGNSSFPMDYTNLNAADLDVYVTETQTGRINFGGAYNSDNGIVGQFTIDEKNFDIARWPRNFREILDGTAWRGAGQTFRLELVPGANLERYLVSFSEPYLFGTDYSFSASAYLFERAYFDWDEHRIGGRFALGRRLTPDLSISAGVRLESVRIDNPRVSTSTVLNDSVGSSNLFLGNVGLVRDTRDNSFQATEGSYFSLTYSQAFGDYSYARGDLDYRRYKLMYERPDGSGRHTVSFGTKLGFSGSSTPIFENYYAGGFSTLRGFDFRGAAPLDGGVRVGGEFQWLNSLEYMFPITADDMIKGVVFCDFGTVEDGVELNAENFRVAPGFGFRVSMPGAGIGAPLAFDFAFPVSTADGDDEKVFSFYLGVLR